MSSGNSSSSKARSQRLVRYGADGSSSFRSVVFNWVRLRRFMYYLLFIGIIAIINESWYPAFFYQIDYVPQRSIASRVEFNAVDAEGTQTARLRAKQKALRVFTKNNKPFGRMISDLHAALETIRQADDYNKVSYRIWSQFMPLKDDAAPLSGISSIQMKQCFMALKSLVKDDEKLSAFDLRLNEALQPYKDKGILFKVETDERLGEMRSDQIKIIPANDSDAQPVWENLENVIIRDWDSVNKRVKQSFGDTDVSDMLFRWLKLNLPATLELNIEQTEKEINQEVEKISDIQTTFLPRMIIVGAGKPISAGEWRFLSLEYKRWRSAQPISLCLLRFFSTWMLMSIVFFPILLFATRMRLTIFENSQQAMVLCIFTLLVLTASKYLSNLGCNAQTMVLFMYGIALGIAYGRKTTMLLLSCVIIASVLGSGGGVMEWLYQTGVMGVAVLPLDRIRNRKKIIFISFGTALTAFVLAITCNILNYQPLDLSLLKLAGISALWIIAGGFLMHGMLPLEERVFGIVTDTQLLELSDAAHPLLQELIQRAPSTYNHSMLVAAIAESAAQSIGAWGLLCRVGSYYHDIGKFVTPDYFVENQKSVSDSQHTNLTPSMSSLVIINHVKDGVALASKWRLPQQVVEFIQQHHGTTLVKYFFSKAQDEQKRKREEEASQSGILQDTHKNSESVDDSMFRYPGPKPQTKEIAIVMLADCVESACRTLVEPTPKRVEDLIKSIYDDKLQDGQFDETGLTFNELRTIQNSMVKSIMSIYHARIKYPTEDKTREN